jgi:hypothetical protein
MHISLIALFVTVSSGSPRLIVRRLPDADEEPYGHYVDLLDQAESDEFVARRAAQAERKDTNETQRTEQSVALKRTRSQFNS